MPRVYVGLSVSVVLQMFPGRNAHVFDKPRRIKALGQSPHRFDPLVCVFIAQLFASNFDRLTDSRWRWVDQLHELGLSAESPRFIEQTPGDNRWVIEVACYRPAHGSFISSTAALRVSALAEVRKVAHQQNTDTIGVVEQHWIIDLDVHAQQVEAYTIRVGNVVTERLCITGCVNAVGIVGLVKRAAQINRFAVQA